MFNENGIQIWLQDDGKEIAYEIPQMLDRIQKLNGECATKRKDYDDMVAKFQPYEGIDPEEARAALELKANINANKLYDAGKVAEIKKDVAGGYEKIMAEKDAETAKEF